MFDCSLNARFLPAVAVTPSCPSVPSPPPSLYAKSCLIPRSCEGSFITNGRPQARGFLWLLHPAPCVVAVHQRGRPALSVEVVVNGALAVQPVTVVVDDEESRGHEPVTCSETQRISQHRQSSQRSANGTRSFGACFV